MTKEIDWWFLAFFFTDLQRDRKLLFDGWMMMIV